MTTRNYPLHLFQATGIELEYMIVDRDTLAVRPIADELLKAVTGTYETEAELGPVALSNELALHVIEMKSNGPAPELSPLSGQFQQVVDQLNALLAPMNARLMPTAMHPTMDPLKEMRLWPHENGPIYQAFDRIFDCRGHGWANLQSTHINLPFSNDEEFGRLHAAIRLILPLLPALAASSPLMEGLATGLLDNRVDVYRGNAARIPSITGLVVPEQAFTEQEYQTRILQPIYRDLAPHDPEGVLQFEWANARGCIARFDRGSIEIRLLDIQECPRMDMAIAATVIHAVRYLCEAPAAAYAAQRQIVEASIAPYLTEATHVAGRTEVTYAEYLKTLGLSANAASVGDIWRHLAAQSTSQGTLPAEVTDDLNLILDQGTLAERILASLDTAFGSEDVCRVYRRLCDCLASGEPFLPLA